MDDCCYIWWGFGGFVVVGGDEIVKYYVFEWFYCFECGIEWFFVYIFEV